MIYCVEDDKSIRDIEVYTLKSTGFEAAGAENAAEFYKAVEQEIPELVILDVMLPGEDGIEILKRLRSSEKTLSVPIIMATAKGEEYDKVTALDQGADDYLVKPFGMMEMVSRVRAVLRRTAKEDKNEQVLKTGNLTLNCGEHLVFSDGKRINLTLKEYRILELMMMHPGIVFTRDRLLSDVWGMDYDGETRTVDVHMRTLRQKLGADGELIETVRGVGYRMEGEKT
jgi:two-component system, OmpR family, alkaline phosphatase synthesis response regulator PhoP